PRDGADVGLLVHRVPAAHAPDRLHEGRDEGVVDALVHVDALHRAAALAGVVHGAIGQRRRRGLHVDVLADVAGVLAAQLQLHSEETAAYRRGDALAGGVRAG